MSSSSSGRWQRYFCTSSRIKKLAGRLDALKEEGVADGAQDDEVNWTMKQLFKASFQGEKVLGVLATRHGRKIDEHVQVAVRSSGTRSRR